MPEATKRGEVKLSSKAISWLKNDENGRLQSRNGRKIIRYNGEMKAEVYTVFGLNENIEEIVSRLLEKGEVIEVIENEDKNQIYNKENER